MKSKLLFCFSIILIISCTQTGDKYNLCDSNYLYCKYFEIQFPKAAEISDDVAQLSIEDINIYRDLNKAHSEDPNSESIFDQYTGMFIPRFSYNLVDESSVEKLWLGLALYPGDEKNELSDLTDYFYGDKKNYNQPIYGDCIKDANSTLSSKNSIIYKCINNDLKSYDYWVTDGLFTWRLKCVWDIEEFDAVNQRLLMIETIRSSDTCRNSFKSFKPKIN